MIYLAFGLTLRSELEFPELLPASGEADIEIAFGRVPAELSNPIVVGARFQADTGRFLLRLDGHARYLVVNGREIIIDRDPAGTSEVIRLFFLSSVMSAALHQRGVLGLRASVVEVNGRGAVLMGASGVGKSTLAAALSQRGHRPVSDDLAAITMLDGRPYVQPGPRRICVWADAAERLGLDINALRRLRPGLEKYAIPMDGHYSEAPVAVSEAFIMSPGAAGALEMEPVRGMEKVIAIARETSWPRLLVDRNWQGRHFDCCAAVAANARVYSLVGPEQQLPIEELARLVELKCVR